MPESCFKRAFECPPCVAELHLTSDMALSFNYGQLGAESVLLDWKVLKVKSHRVVSSRASLAWSLCCVWGHCT
ncbi:hypothetical protein FRX31_004247 [Thalictrum thalictroides]|uniref:Uncharacterized protein n=1 Tax=Thalictrum thalictroides TaxID=46969 RepID=A0A7J6XB11_THATH|nr:hypothetical protein FRX31_004247 [Thalictrum thalictroides]